MPDKKERNGLSTPLKRFFGVGDFGFTLMSNIDTFYATYFFTNIAKFSLGVITVMTTISAVVDAILSCLYGPFLNKIKPKRWGRYRSWLILTPWMVPFLYAMQFIKIGNGLAAAIFVTVAMITSRIAWNIPFIANVSMINIAGKTPKERMTLSSTRMVWTSLASVVYSYAGPAAVSVFAAWLGEKNAYAATAFAFSALMAAGFYAHFNMFKGYEMTKEEELQRMAGQARSAQTAPNAQKVRALDAIRCNPHLLWLFLSCITKYIVLFLVNGLAIYYLCGPECRAADHLCICRQPAWRCGFLHIKIHRWQIHREEDRGLFLPSDGSYRHRRVLCLQSDLGGYGRHVCSHVHTCTDQCL